MSLNQKRSSTKYSGGLVTLGSLTRAAGFAIRGEFMIFVENNDLSAASAVLLEVERPTVLSNAEVKSPEIEIEG